MSESLAPEPAGRLSESCEVEYLARVNRTIDYITRDLRADLSLDALARVACFSPFHFHRVFRAIVGETPNDFIKRTRLERALFLMAQPRRPSLTEIAHACGFSSSSDFSRNFRAAYGVPARAFDIEAHRAAHREALAISALPAPTDSFPTTLRSLPARRVAYLRVFRPYGGDGVMRAVEQLMAWARARGLEGGQWLGYQWDDPELVALDQCRYDVGLEIPEAVALGEGVHEARFPRMRVAEVQIRGPVDDELRALWWLYGAWLPRSGFAPDHQPCFEAWDGAPFAHGVEHFELRVQIAVTPLS